MFQELQIVDKHIFAIRAVCETFPSFSVCTMIDDNAKQ